MTYSKPPRRHIVIPDTQVRPGVDTSQIAWVARAIVEYKPDVIVHLGDHWDMPSLSTWNAPGSLEKEGARILDDVLVGNDAMIQLFAPQEVVSAQKRKNKDKSWDPERHVLRGNHEDRIDRAVQADPRLQGIVSMDMLYTPPGVQVHPYLKLVEIDGITYSHYFANSHSGRAIGGSIENRLNKIGRSFVQGHEQGFLYGVKQYPGAVVRHGLVAGSCYLHDEKYRGLQSNSEWRGIVVLNEVHDGKYDIMPLSMAYLQRRFGD